MSVSVAIFSKTNNETDHTVISPVISGQYYVARSVAVFAVVIP